MNILQRLEQWGDNHHPKWLDIIRIILGVFLCYKGIDFLQNMGTLMSIMSNKVQFSSLMFIVLGHYVVFAHIIGGILLTIGLFTRFACLIQIPILLVAVVFINAGGNMMRPYSEFFLSLIVLLLLIYFLVVGNGPWSFKLADEKKRSMP
jgi:putative oxidoreductase